MNVVFWTASEDGSSWYRCDMPAAALTWRGHRVWCSRVLPESRKRSADVVIGSRVAAAGGAVAPAWQQLHDRGCRLVLDLDDHYFAIEPTNPAYRDWAPDGPITASLAANIAIADTVTVPTAHLAEEIRRCTGHPDVRVIPNGLHAGLLAMPRTYQPGAITLGWAGSGDTIRGLPLAARALQRILDYRPPGRYIQPGPPPTLQLIGATLEAAAEAGLQHPRISAVEWVDGTDVYLQQWLAKVDVLVAPYADTLYNRCKFPTKALEAAFLGLPLVVSDIEPYRRWVREHSLPNTAWGRALECGIYLVDDEHDWGYALKSLVDDPELRRQMGQAARAVAAKYTLQGPIGDAWESVLSKGAQ